MATKMNYGHKFKATILDCIKAGDLTEIGAYKLFGMTSLEIRQMQAAREKYGDLRIRKRREK